MKSNSSISHVVRTLKYLLIFWSLIPLATYAQEFAAKVLDTYIQTDQNFDLDCYYSKNETFKLITPVNNTLKAPNQISREFVIENQDRKIPMSFTLSRLNKSFEYKVLLDRIHVS